MKIFITGKPGCGKTTLIKELIKKLKINYTGFLTEEIREKRIRKGFKVIDLKTNKSGILAEIGHKGPRVSKYGVNLSDFEKIAIPSLKRDANLIIIDEIGKMEMFSSTFRSYLEKILNSEKNLIATLGRDYIHQFKKYGNIIWLTKENYSKVKEEIERKIKQLL